MALKNFSIDLTLDAGLAALKTYATKLEATDPKKAADAHDALADAKHEKDKADRRAKLLAPKPAVVQPIKADTTEGAPAGESEDDTQGDDDLAVNDTART
jgi:hypothetical protein